MAEHTELFSFQPTVTSNTIQIGDGLVPTQATVQDGTAPWTDTVFLCSRLRRTVTILLRPSFGWHACLRVDDAVRTGAFNPAHAATLKSYPDSTLAVICPTGVQSRALPRHCRCLAQPLA